MAAGKAPRWDFYWSPIKLAYNRPMKTLQKSNVTSLAGLTALGASVVGFAIGAAAVGALAVGALAIGRVAIKRGRIDA